MPDMSTPRSPRVDPRTVISKKRGSKGFNIQEAAKVKIAKKGELPPGLNKTVENSQGHLTARRADKETKAVVPGRVDTKTAPNIPGLSRVIANAPGNLRSTLRQGDPTKVSSGKSITKGM